MTFLGMFFFAASETIIEFTRNRLPMGWGNLLKDHLNSISYVSPTIFVKELLRKVKLLAEGPLEEVVEKIKFFDVRPNGL